MLKILANDGMDNAAITILEECGHYVDTNFYNVEELKEKLLDFDVLIVRSATKVREELIDVVANGSLKLIIRAGVGIDNIDHNYAEGKGISVKNTPKSSSSAVAELAIAHMFALARFINISNVTMRNGEWNKKAYKGIEINGKTLGIIGFGRIGKELARKGEALGMKIVYTDIFGKSEGFDNYEFLSQDELLAVSDFISLHVPFIKENGATISEKEFKLMKKSAFIINAARGGVIDENALLNALNNGDIAGAGIDVFEEEPTKNEKLINHPKVSVTPHIGASTNEAQTRIGNETIDTIKEFFSI
ncbi:D-2-hydroxyacid dehydrogenase [Helicovermis profundi]|uniref:NAD(P)-dependent oxidoreductase n=1 Tax=Helicovermis profundi TaxID=3065157 RepID=A0AAU9EMW7_9FIRM|nr:NAD(P)-dependent oxidoreductase [Clostridia bacterium S502]